MKRKLVLILAIMLLIISTVGFGIIKHIESNLESLKYIQIPEVDMSEIRDGVYSGSYSAAPVSAEVSVTVKDHIITDIQIIKHINGQGSPAEIITDRVIKSQSLHVDSVTGATYSSKVILLAIKNALLGKNNP